MTLEDRARQHLSTEYGDDLDWSGKLKPVVDRLAYLLRDVRREALEEAAREVERVTSSGTYYPESAIRALISSEEVRRG